MADLIVPDIGTASAVAVSAATDQTVAATIQAVMSHLHTGTRIERDKLASPFTASGTTLTTTYSVPAIKAGARLNVDLEDFHVWAVAGATVTVQPGEFGSTSANHLSGAIVHVNPEFSQFEVFRALNDELRSLSGPGGLFRVRTVTLAYNPTFLGYNLTGVTNVDGIVSVVAETTGSEKGRQSVPWRLERNMDTDVFASGFALMVYEGWSGRDVFVTYKDQFGGLTSLTENVSAATGLPVSAHDVLVMGAALRLAAPAEIDRNQLASQGQSRRANEVPAGSRVNAIRGLAAQYQRRLVQEANRQKRAYPTRLPRR